MSTLMLRDRDAIITREGLIFRVFGYFHMPNAFICDVEYVPSKIFTSSNPKAFRNQGKAVYYKFFEDEGFKFLKKYYPQYLMFDEKLGTSVVAVAHSDINRVLKPEKKLDELFKAEPKDELVTALHSLLTFVTQCSGLKVKDFGVFGSILHGFYHPKFSDLDFVVYSREKLSELLKTLREIYATKDSLLSNEFEDNASVKGKKWRFENYSVKDYLWHQKRKLIYALFNDSKSKRIIKTEFEPVKNWQEITTEKNEEVKICKKGWVKMFARVVDDSNAPFIPSVYGVQPLEILQGIKEAAETKRIVSFMEEFRMQAWKDEKIYVEGNLEEVITPKDSFYQITLTYCPRYYEQVLKVIS
ncbi:MAG: nucleotidyltransferase domain-containing protein [Candidatus Bathyarchaeia archaeon]